MAEILNLIKKLNNIIWGLPLSFLLMGTHLFFTFYLKFIQVKIFKGIRLSVKPSTSGEGETSSFGSLTTTLAATLGTGNIVGVSTAVALGGPGAVFWCWVTGLLGMATTYAESYLSILYRVKHKDGSISGGPMYVLEKGLKSKSLACLYCFFTLMAAYGVGCSTQSNAITNTTSTLWGFSPHLVGILIALITGFAIIGGIKSISNLCSKLVPFMGIFYLLACTFLLILNKQYIIPTIKVILHTAFAPYAIAGGVIGATIKRAARYGIARGLFTNEAGLGTAGIAAATAKTERPEDQALVSMSATFWDTVVMCAITGIVIVANIIRNPESIQKYSIGEYTTAAFLQIPYVGETLLGIAIILFALATLVGWSYFGEKAVEYLFGKSGISTYRICYIVMIYIGGVLPLDFVWELTDLINALMIPPNLIALWFLYKKIKPAP